MTSDTDKTISEKTLRKFVHAEREANAKLCEKLAAPFTPNCIAALTCMLLASQIRDRGSDVA